MNISEWSLTRKVTVIFAAFAISFAISVGLSQAQTIPMVGDCIDSDTLWLHQEIYDGSVWNNLTVEYMNCPLGCIENATAYGDACKQPEIERDEPNLMMVAIIVFGILMIIFSYLSIKVGEEHWPMQMLFLALALIFGATLLNSSMIIMNNIGQTTIAGHIETIYSGYVIITIFVGFYYAVKFFQFVAEKMAERKAKKKRKREEDD